MIADPCVCVSSFALPLSPMPSNLTSPLAAALFSPPRTSTLPRPICLPPRRADIYPSVSIERIFKNHFGYSAELPSATTGASITAIQKYRPVFYDFNAVSLYAPRFAKKTADFHGWRGRPELLFYDPSGNCNFPRLRRQCEQQSLPGSRRRWRPLQLVATLVYSPRSESTTASSITSDFHSDNVLRLGASVGYTFPRRLMIRRPVLKQIIPQRKKAASLGRCLSVFLCDFRSTAPVRRSQLRGSPDPGARSP